MVEKSCQDLTHILYDAVSNINPILALTTQQLLNPFSKYKYELYCALHRSKNGIGTMDRLNIPVRSLYMS